MEAEQRENKISNPENLMSIQPVFSHTSGWTDWPTQEPASDLKTAFSSKGA